ncbi:MAG: hypothetical protein JWN64_446 [Parcubacteria group bacterium]|nr:hypothetical protein [Parcubacteria group bacterium]
MPYKYGALALQPRYPKILVWAIPVSLAATKGITRVTFHSHETYARTESNSLLFYFHPGTEMFHFPGFAPLLKSRVIITDRVSPFGYLRIKGYKSPPRSISLISRVLHRCCKPRHPPCTLNVSCAETYTPLNVFYSSDSAIQAVRTVSMKTPPYTALIPIYIFVCQSPRVASRKKPLPGRLQTSQGLAAYPLRLVSNFLFFNT